MTLSLGSRNVGVVGRDVVIRIVSMLAVRGMLMIGELTCSDVGDSRNGARTADNCEEGMHAWS